MVGDSTDEVRFFQSTEILATAERPVLPDLGEESGEAVENPQGQQLSLL
jgi:hypothetical protein